MTPVNTRFLIADDDMDDASLFCEAIHEIAPMMICLKAENGRDVLALLSQEDHPKPDFIFLDINMPTMNGWECLRRLKGDLSFRGIPIIIYSTSSAKRDVDLAYELGALLYLTKPEDFRELRKILEIIASNPQDALLNMLSRFANVRVSST